MVLSYQNSMKSLHRLLLLSLGICCVNLAKADFLQPPSLTDLHKGSSATSVDSCKGDTACENSVIETECSSKGICTLKCPNSSRQDYPSSEVLTSTSLCQGVDTNSPPSAANTSNGYFFTNSTRNVNCTVNQSVIVGTSGNFGLSFWISGSCSTKCSIFRVGALTVALSGQKLEVNNNSCSSCTDISSTGWKHVTITRRLDTKVIDLYIDNTKQAFNLKISGDIGSTAVLGPSTAPADNDSYTVLDARFFSDGLTTREIEGLFVGAFPSKSPVSDCRCPVAKPDISSDGLTCTNTTKRLVKMLHSENAMLDGNSTTAWVSKASTSVVVVVNLGNSFQIRGITVTFDNPEPSRTKWEFLGGNSWSDVDSGFYTCNSNSCNRNSNEISTYTDFKKTIATELKMTFTYRTSSSHIIKGITITGSCDCDGSASTCTKSAGDPDFTCTCLNSTMGDNCRSCINGKYRMETQFGCHNSCECHDHGVNVSDVCEPIGGACKCKENVEGVMCDTCKRLTYNLTGDNPDGCTLSICDDNGSVRCNNATGECFCQPKVEGVKCDKCIANHYGIQFRTGCSPCKCHPPGTTDGNDTCHQTNGQCNCKTNVQGRQCDECKDEFHGLDSSQTNGCLPCNCNSVGTNNMVCNKTTGQCKCRGDDFTNLLCKPIANKPVPSYGPISGGTVVRITGHYLNNSTDITINDIHQDIINKSDTYIEIITKTVTSVASEKLRITWADQDDEIQQDFTYKPDPVVKTDDIPKTNKASKSGGCTIQFKGDYLNSVAEPKIVAKFGNTTSEPTICKHVGTDGKSIRCPTPRVSNNTTNGMNGSVDLQLDGIIKSNITSVTVTPDTTIDKKRIEFAPPFEKTVTITGTNLGTDCDKTDYLVYIGSEDSVCTVTSFSQTKIECQPPQDPPRADRFYDLKVRIGTREVTVGEIDYKPFWLTSYFVYIVVGCGLFLIAVIIIAICICCCRCRRNRRRQMSTGRTADRPFSTLSETSGRNSSLPLIEQQPITIIHPYENPSYTPDDTPSADDVVTSEFFLHRVEESIRASVKESIIGESCFKAGNICVAKGGHARLIDGTFTARSSINPSKKITMKMLLDPLPENGVLSPKYTSALRECLRLKPHTDDNVLSIHGIGLDKKRFYIIYPYMEKKTLKHHVMDTQQNFVLRQLLEFALQVCEGMEYLASRNIVHKDIATRNCMVDGNDNVKISDSAFSWDFYPDEYMYDSMKDRYLPVRWMAPESLTSGFYDTKSDVWAFGVLMWELLTRGSKPFHELKDEEVRDYINDGYRLGKPVTVSDDVYGSMNSCWIMEEDQRPSFLTLQRLLEASLINRDSMNEDLYVNAEQTESFYINQDEIQRLRRKAPPRPARR